MLNPSFDVALARTEGAGVNEVTPAVFPDQGEAAGLEIPARLCREPGGGAPEGTLQGALRNARKLTLILNLYL
jgi:hypothetical protein